MLTNHPTFFTQKLQENEMEGEEKRKRKRQRNRKRKRNLRQMFADEPPSVLHPEAAIEGDGGGGGEEKEEEVEEKKKKERPSPENAAE